MKFKVNDIVEVVSADAFYYKAMGRIDSILVDPELDYFEYKVVFEMIDMKTDEVTIYEECVYLEEEIELVKRGN